MGIALTPEEQFEIFGTAKLGQYTQEARQRWGDTEAWQQSRQRAASYTKDDWIAIQAEADQNIAEFASALRAGEPATGAVAMDLAQAHRQQLSRWFFDCGPDLHRGLAQMYVADQRFAANYDNVAAGLARYVSDAMQANAERG
jgi:hypothetical protein